MITFNKKQTIVLAILAIVVPIVLIVSFFRILDLEKYEAYIEKDNLSDILTVGSLAEQVEYTFENLDMENITDYHLRIIASYLINSEMQLHELDSKLRPLMEDYYNAAINFIIKQLSNSSQILKLSMLNIGLGDYDTIPEEEGVLLDLSQNDLAALQIIRDINNIIHVEIANANLSLEETIVLSNDDAYALMSAIKSKLYTYYTDTHGLLTSAEIEVPDIFVHLGLTEY